MLMAQLCMAMIRTDEQIVAGDVVVLIERRSVTRYDLCILSPLKLHIMIERVPGHERAMVQLRMFQLCRSTRRQELAPGLPVADPIAVIECNIAGGTPAISERLRRNVFGHSSIIVLPFPLQRYEESPTGKQ